MKRALLITLLLAQSTLFAGCMNMMAAGMAAECMIRDECPLMGR